MEKKTANEMDTECFAGLEWPMSFQENLRAFAPGAWWFGTYLYKSLRKPSFHFILHVLFLLLVRCRGKVFKSKSPQPSNSGFHFFHSPCIVFLHASHGFEPMEAYIDPM